MRSEVKEVPAGIANRIMWKAILFTSAFLLVVGKLTHAQGKGLFGVKVSAERKSGSKSWA